MRDDFFSQYKTGSSCKTKPICTSYSIIANKRAKNEIAYSMLTQLTFLIHIIWCRAVVLNHFWPMEPSFSKKIWSIALSEIIYCTVNVTIFRNILSRIYGTVCPTLEIRDRPIHQPSWYIGPIFSLHRYFGISPNGWFYQPHHVLTKRCYIHNSGKNIFFGKENLEKISIFFWKKFFNFF